MPSTAEASIATPAKEEQQQSKSQSDKQHPDAKDDGNQREDTEAGDAAAVPDARERWRSDAERRDDLEQQRDERHERQTRASLRNNRFFSRASADAAAAEPPNEDNQAEEKQKDATRDSDDQDRELQLNARAGLAQTLLVWPTKRRDKRKSKGNAEKDKADNNGDDERRSRNSHAVTWPAQHSQRVPTPWTRRVEQAEASGLFVAHMQIALKQIPPSTQVRLQERLEREAASSSDPRDDDQWMWMRALLEPALARAEITPDLFKFQAPPAISPPASASAECARSDLTSPPIATLRVTIDRLVLDDHACFSLLDRVTAQVQSVFASYTRHMQAPAIAALSERLRAYLETSASATMPPIAAARAQAWQDAAVLLAQLRQWQDLHALVLAKWNDLQACYREVTPNSSRARIRVDIVPEADHPSGDPLQMLLALVELETDCKTERKAETETASRVVESTRRHLTELGARDQFLRCRLQLRWLMPDAPSASASASPSPSPSRQAWPWPAFASTTAMPRFLAVLYVNDHEAARTRVAFTMRTSRGAIVARFDEPLHLRLQHFPDRLALQIVERTRWRDQHVTAAAIPLLVPGHDAASSTSSDATAIAAASLAASREWYQFRSPRMIARSQWHASFLNATQLRNTARYPQGRALIHVQWVDLHAGKSSMTTPHAALALLPRRRPQLATARGQLVGPAVHHALDREGPPAVDVPLDTFDRFDPDNALLRLGIHQQRPDPDPPQAFCTSALGPWLVPPSAQRRVALTQRNAVLRARDREHVARHGTSICMATAAMDDLQRRQLDHASRWRSDHAVFELPVPLLDAELASDARHLRLLRAEMRGLEQSERARALAELPLQTALDSSTRLQQARALRLRGFLDRCQQLQRRQQLQQQSCQRQPQRTLASIVQEQPMPLLPGTLDLSSLSGLFARRRRLRPQLRTRVLPPSHVVAQWPTACQLYVQIKHATNVPMREQDAAASMLQPAHVFVALTFQDAQRRTSAVLTSAASNAGANANAVWMETLSFPVRPPRDDWRPENLDRMTSALRVKLFDQRVVTASDDSALPAAANDVDTDADAAQRRAFLHDRRVLGSLELPFSTLYRQNGVLDVALRFDMPVARVGYRHAHHQAQPETVDQRDPEPDRDGHADVTFLHVRMTLDPLLPLAPIVPRDSANDAKIDSSMDSAARLAHYVAIWTKSLPTHDLAVFPLLVPTLAHGVALLSQLLGDTSPPPSLPATAAAMARFVSLVPFFEDVMQAGTAEADPAAEVDPDPVMEMEVWCTSQELLEIGAGDLAAHAVLLCNLLLHLGDRAYLVLGTAVPEGRTIYVLQHCQQDRSSNDQRWLWDVRTGRAVSTSDDRCSVLQIAAVISRDNIFANLQRRDARVFEMDWDIERPRSAAWKPLFATPQQRDMFTLPRVPASLTLVYREPSAPLALQIETELREVLKLEIRRWRAARATTTFQLELARQLREELAQYEQRALQQDMSGKMAPPPVCVLDEQRKTHEIDGVAIQLPFTDVARVVERVKATHIHWNERPRVEFALAVFVHGYPNDVLSVWVYLASLVPK